MLPSRRSVPVARRIVPVSVVLVLAAALVPAAAPGSIWIASNASKPSLKVDARGYAEVGWTEGGRQRTQLVPPSGEVLPGGHVSGADVSRPETGVSIPFAQVVRRTPDGWIWALQAWRVQPGGPVDLRLSRWRGAPTQVEAQVVGDRLKGRATFGGRGVYGFSSTPEGKQVRHYAWIDCLGCGSSDWKRLLGVKLAGPGGTFALFLGPGRRGTSYRVTVEGPNRGTTRAPDASVIVARAP